MTIEAKEEKEADAKMQAIIVLASKLNEKELTKLAHVIKHDPIKTRWRKRSEYSQSHIFRCRYSSANAIVIAHIFQSTDINSSDSR